MFSAKRISSSRLYHEVRSIIRQRLTDGAEHAAGINHIVDGIKGGDHVELRIIRAALWLRRAETRHGQQRPFVGASARARASDSSLTSKP